MESMSVHGDADQFLPKTHTAAAAQLRGAGTGLVQLQSSPSASSSCVPEGMGHQGVYSDPVWMSLP